MTLTQGLSTMTGSGLPLRSTDTGALLHKESQFCRSAPLPPLYWSMALTHPASSSRATSTPRGLDSSMPARASMVVSSATTRPIPDSSGRGGATSPSLAATFLSASHCLNSSS